MKFYVRELPQKQYRESTEMPILPSKCEFKPNDIWYGHFGDYLIDKVEYSKGDLKVYATKIPIAKRRANTCYKKGK